MYYVLITSCRILLEQ